MALRAFQDRQILIEKRVEEICSTLKHYGYPEHNLPPMKAVFSEAFNYEERNGTIQNLLYSDKFMHYICKQICGVEPPDTYYPDIGTLYHHQSAKLIKRINDRNTYDKYIHYGPLFRPGNYVNSRQSFCEFRSHNGKYRELYGLNVAGVEKASSDQKSQFWQYFIAEDGAVKKHVQYIQSILQNLQKSICEYYWLPLANVFSPEILKLIHEILSDLSTGACVTTSGVGLKFRTDLRLEDKSLRNKLYILKKLLKPEEFHILAKGIFLSQNNLLPGKPYLILPRVKNAKSIIRKMYFKERLYGHPVLLSELSDLTGACIVGENYIFIENMMNLIKAKASKLVIEEENLFQINKKDSAYRDVKFIIVLSHPLIKNSKKDDNTSNHICYELQIKTAVSKIFHDLDHAAIYKSKLPEEDKDYLKQPLWGALWQKELSLLEEYEWTNNAYLKWFLKYFADFN